MNQHERLLLPLGIALVLLALYGPTLLGHARASADPFVFSDDARVLIHPQFRLEDPALFPRDPSVDYFLASLPDGYALVYRALGPLVGVAALSKLLPYVLLAVTLAGLGLAAARLSGPPAAFAALALALGSDYVLGRMVGGLPRSFAQPVLALGALALVFGRARSLAVLCVIGASTYPAVGLTLGVALTLLLALPNGQRGCTDAWTPKQRALLLALTGAAAVLVLVPSFLRLRAYGEAIGPSLVAAYPEAGPWGRFDPVDRPPFPALPGAAVEPLVSGVMGQGRPLVRALKLGLATEPVLCLLAVLALAGCAVLAWRRVEARRFLLLPLAVVVCHTLALALAPRLFLPQRYVAYAVPVTALIALPSALGMLRDSQQRWLRTLPWVLAVALLALFGSYGVPWAGLTVRVPDAEKPLHAALARLPRDAVIAAFPSETSDSIPYVARRSVYLSDEAHMPFHVRYADLMRTRARTLFRAYFAASVDTLRELRDREHVTHLLVDTRHFEHRPMYFAPFDPDVAAAYDAGHARGFAALALPEAARVATVRTFVLFDLGRL